METNTLAGKVAVVTGASRGIGLAIAKGLAAQGCSVAITGRSKTVLGKPLETVIGSSHHGSENQPLQHRAFICDVRDEKAVRSLFQSIKRDFRRLDVLINNAGISHALHNVEDMPLQVWREVLDTNLTGMFLCTRAALPLMGHGGVIVNNLSVAARGVFPGESAYGASKHGALGFTETLRKEVRDRGIRVVSLMPGPTDTNIWKQFLPDVPRDKMMSPDTVARVVVNIITLPQKATVEEISIAPTNWDL